MNYLKLLFSSVILLASCAKDPYDPGKYLSAKEQNDLINKTIRYSTALAPRATHATKFDSAFNWYYERAAAECEVIAYYPLQSGEACFLIQRKARSITPMKEGIAGKLKTDASNMVAEYEEIFRTWKMPEDTLRKRGLFLFDRMVKGRDLSLYYSRYQFDRYIEFPDDRFYFDREQKKWRDKVLDSLNFPSR